MQFHITNDAAEFIRERGGVLAVHFIPPIS
jgi:hypothetical protein